MSDSETGLGNEVRGRIFRATAYGDNASEIEIAALTAAQEFFGDGVPLEIVHDYQASLVGRAGPAAGKKYAADVRVRTLS